MSASLLETAWAALLLGGTLALLFVVLHLASTLLERSGPIRLRHWAEEGGGRLRDDYARPARFEAFRYLLGFAAKAAALGGVLCVAAVAPRRDAIELLGVFLAAGAALATIDLLIRRWALSDREPLLRRLTPFYRAALWCAQPLLPLLAPLFRRSGSEEGEEDDASDEEIAAYIDVGAREGILEPGEGALIHRVIDFGDRAVKSVMTPRIDIVAASASTPLRELAAVFLEASHSRLPLYGGSIDEVVGVLHIRDLLRGLEADPDQPVARLAREPFFVPGTKQLDQLLPELQARRRQMAIVVDEYGGTAGLATLEDLIEEIVGEIIDEDEEGAPLHEALADGRWRVDGSMSLEELDDLFDTDLETQEFETVGGLVFGTLGHVPEPAEVVQLDGLVLEVDRVEGRRVLSVIVEQRETPSPDEMPVAGERR